jgi:hypothetical protein
VIFSPLDAIYLAFAVASLSKGPWQLRQVSFEAAVAAATACGLAAEVADAAPAGTAQTSRMIIAAIMRKNGLLNKDSHCSFIVLLLQN